MKRLRPGFLGWLTVIVSVLIVLSIWWSPRVKQSHVAREEALTSRQVALTCTTDMATKYHIHPELAIVINGTNVPIPNGIGIRPSCMTSIHTHDAGGVIHVEAPIAKDFVLGDFFAVWNKDFSQDKLLDVVVTPTTEIVVTVNGEKVETYENTILRDKDKIVISYQTK